MLRYLLIDLALKICGRWNSADRAFPPVVKRELEAWDAEDMLAGQLTRFRYHLETDSAVGIDLKLHFLHLLHVGRLGCPSLLLLCHELLLSFLLAGCRRLGRPGAWQVEI